MLFCYLGYFVAAVVCIGGLSLTLPGWRIFCPCAFDLIYKEIFVTVNIRLIWSRFYPLKENDGFTTPPQQLHNTPSHGGEAQCVGLIPCEGVLYNCCTGKLYETNISIEWDF